MTELVGANNFRIAYRAIQSALGKDDHNKLLNLSRGFFVTAKDALIAGLIIEVSKLFDTNSDAFSLRHLLNEFSQKIPNMSQRIRGWKKDITKHSRVIENLWKQRSQYYAHKDKDYLHNPNQLLLAESPISFIELEELVDLSGRIYLGLAAKIRPSGTLYLDGYLYQEHRDDLCKLLDKVLCSGGFEGIDK